MTSGGPKGDPGIAARRAQEVPQGRLLSQMLLVVGRDLGWEVVTVILS
jgi:hypothetical protein